MTTYLQRIIGLSCLIILTLTTVASQQFRAILITETGGWHHPSITSATPAMEELAARHNFVLDRYQPGMKLTEEMLAPYDVAIFVNTTMDIFDEAEQAAFEKFIQSGNGFVGVHAASDTEYDWEWYTKMVGHMFVIHPVVQTAMIDVSDRNFPGLERWPDRLLWTDEYYEFTPAKTQGLNYLLTIDESTYDPKADWGTKKGVGMGDFHPISWYHEYDGGRAFYTALGHMPEVYSDKLFLEHVYGGIYWAATGKGL